MFYNVTNHPYSKWSKEQKEAAGSAVDVGFPNVDPSWSTEKLRQLAEQTFDDLTSVPPETEPVYLIQGEMGLTHLLVSLLKERGYKCVHACSERQTIETVSPSGETVKRSVFGFVQFREY